IIPHGEHQINIAQYLYEMLVLAVPQKRVHPGVLDGTLKSDILERLQKLRPNEIREDSSESDPRWDILKKLITDK
ncbi:MAG: YceD family protein, partial [Bacteroidota bacterium]